MKHGVISITAKATLSAKSMPAIRKYSNLRLYVNFIFEIFSKHLNLNICRSLAPLMIVVIQVKRADLKPTMSNIWLPCCELILRASRWAHQDGYRAFKIGFTLLTPPAYLVAYFEISGIYVDNVSVIKRQKEGPKKWNKQLNHDILVNFTVIFHVIMSKTRASTNQKV